MSAVSKAFLHSFINTSAKPFASGSPADFTGLCSMTAHLKYLSKRWFSLPLNGGPLSVFRRWKHPCLAKMLLMLQCFLLHLCYWLLQFQDIWRVHLQLLEIIIHLPLVPSGSAERFFHCFSGGVDGFKRSLCFFAVASRHAKQPWTIIAICLYIPENHSLDLTYLFMAFSPGWISCAMSSIFVLM